MNLHFAEGRSSYDICEEFLIESPSDLEDHFECVTCKVMFRLCKDLAYQRLFHDTGE